MQFPNCDAKIRPFLELAKRTDAFLMFYNIVFELDISYLHL